MRRPPWTAVHDAVPAAVFERELTKKLTVKAHRFSASAKEKIQKAGGTAEIVGGVDTAASAE